MKRWTHFFAALTIAAGVFFAAADAPAQEQDQPVTSSAAVAPASDPAALAAVAEKLAPSLVHVEYTLKYDRGEPPVAGGWSTRCPNCGGYHGNDAEGVIKDDRPFEIAGFVVAPDTILTADPLIHPRFLKEIRVRFGDESVLAKPMAFAKNQTAVLLKLDKPLKGVKALKFDAAKKGPYLAVTHTQSNGVWTTSAQPVGGPVSTATDGRRFIPAPSYSLIVDQSGAPVGAAMRDELPLDGSWKGSPLKWEMYSVEEQRALKEMAQQVAKNALLPVTLNFRSPKAAPARDMYRGPQEQDATVRHVVGVLLDKTTLLVLSELAPNVTARLERIRVKGPDGKTASATFKFTLNDYGAFVATLDKPMDSPLTVAKSDLLQYRGVLLPAVLIQQRGDKRTDYFDHRRISSFNIGWRRQLYPELPGGGQQNLFLFDSSGALVALPIIKREKADAERQRWAPMNEGGTLTAASYVAAAVANPDRYADAGNVPLSEEEENRLAWLGVELQALTPELARANDVSHLTNDGQSGALVTHVYPDSPAAKAGIEPGAVLLRIHVEDYPKPIEVQVEQSPFGDQPFPWDQYDNLPEQYFDQIPQPWPSAENTFTRSLTDLGFGKKFEAEFAQDGKGVRTAFTVEQSPPHFDAAPRYKSDAMGMTVRDLTYEVRRYFQRADDEPGVIISKLEMGSKASIAGLKPFEVVTHVNEQPVMNVKDFEAQVKDQKSLRLTIKRMTKGRQVKINLAGKTNEKNGKNGKTPVEPLPPEALPDNVEEFDAPADDADEGLDADEEAVDDAVESADVESADESTGESPEEDSAGEAE